MKVLRFCIPKVIDGIVHEQPPIFNRFGLIEIKGKNVEEIEDFVMESYNRMFHGGVIDISLMEINILESDIYGIGGNCRGEINYYNGEENNHKDIFEIEQVVQLDDIG